MPLAFFCTLFFRHRKKSVSAPWDGQSQSAPESARQAPPKGNFSRQSCRLSIQAGGFPRGKQSAWRALPCVPLVVCLNSGSLTAFGGCAHWARASLRSPQSPSGRSWRKTQRGINIPAEKQGAFHSPPAPLRIATRSNRAPHRAASPSPTPESARQSPPGQIPKNPLKKAPLLFSERSFP